MDISHLREADYVPDKLRKLQKRSVYCAATLLWWDTWANSEQAPFFAPTDWMRLQMMAPLVEAYYRRPGHNALAEIRQNESLLGATITDRMRLKMAALRDKSEGTPQPPTIEIDMQLYEELNG